VLRPAAFANSTIRQITEDKMGNLWLATQGGHVVKWDPRTDSFTLMQKFTSIVFRLYTDSEGKSWVCTKSNGVHRIDAGSGRIIHSYTADGPKGQRLMLTTSSDVIQYDDSLFIIASGCLNIVNIRTHAIRYFSTEHGLPSNSVINIVKDARGYLWLTLESG